MHNSSSKYDAIEELEAPLLYRLVERDTRASLMYDSRESRSKHQKAGAKDSRSAYTHLLKNTRLSDLCTHHHTGVCATLFFIFHLPYKRLSRDPHHMFTHGGARYPSNERCFLIPLRAHTIHVKCCCLYTFINPRTPPPATRVVLYLADLQHR